MYCPSLICRLHICRALEGPWSEVMQAIHDCHAAVHAKGAERIATDVRIGTRTDKPVAIGKVNDTKLTRVEDILAEEGISTSR